MVYICNVMLDGITYEVYQGTSGTMYFNKQKPLT